MNRLQVIVLAALIVPFACLAGGEGQPVGVVQTAHEAIAWNELPDGREGSQTACRPKCVLTSGFIQ